MSILKDMLAELKPGASIRLTQENGQTIDGIVRQNDGTESLSIEISAVAVFRYQQIAGIQINGISAQPVSIPSPENSSIVSDIKSEEHDVDHVEIHLPVCDKDSISIAFKAMESEKRKVLTPSFDKYQSFLKSHDKEKLNEALEFIWNKMADYEWDYDSQVNLYYANMAFAAEEYDTASESFFYGNDTRQAYCTAYHGALVFAEGKEKLYQSAASFAVIYLCEKTEYAEEALEVLKNSCLALKDISAVAYLFGRNPESKAYVRRLADMLAIEAKKSYPDKENLTNYLNFLKQAYPITETKKIIREYLDNKPDIPKAPPQPAPTAPAEPTAEYSTGTNTLYSGKIVKYKYSEDKGEIMEENGTAFPFNLMDISDASLKAQVKKIGYTNFDPIYVRFSIGRRYGQNIALNIKRGSQPVEKEIIYTMPSEPVSIVPNNSNMTQADTLFANQKYEDAIAAYRKCLTTENWETAFTQIIMCYMALWNLNGDQGYSNELNALVDKYASQLSKTTKNMNTMHQLYMKTHRYQECLNALNILIDLCEPGDYKRTLHYLSTKARCYRFLGDYNSAISQLKDWLEIVRKYKISENIQTKGTIYMELAELYYEIHEDDQAERCANQATYSERKHALLQKIAERRPKVIPDQQADDAEEGNTSQMIEEPEQTVSIEEAYADYVDEDGFASMKLSDQDIADQIPVFQKNQLYCLLTYLAAAAQLSASVPETVRSVSAEENISIHQAIQSLNDAFSYAFHSPLSDLDTSSPQIICTFQNVKKLIPAMNDNLLASATLRVLFNHSLIPDYNLTDLTELLKTTKTAELFPSLVPLADIMQDFRQHTGYGMDAFADYKTNSKEIERIIQEAKEFRERLEKKSETSETQGQVRRMGIILFCEPENSELRACLDIVAQNDNSRLSYVKETIQELFIRNGRPIEVENIDSRKMDKYIDTFWDKARDVIQAEKRHIERPYDKLKGSKRVSVTKKIEKILTYLCDWISAAEYASVENDNAKSYYESCEKKILSILEELIKTTQKTLSSQFDWGTESIRLTAQELLDKINGVYDPRQRKYMFIPFLTGDEILLKEDYLPEMESSFCGLDDFNLLSRILRHAKAQPKDLNDRINEIFSNDLTKNNCRSARLIKEYAEDLQLEKITQNPNFAYLFRCTRDGRKRMELLHENFCNEMELYESYRRISDINGEKSRILRCANAWYLISHISGDYGFYAKLLEIFRNRIAVSAAEVGERLTRQLDELSANPEIDFGVYPKDKILEFITDQNYTVAEDMMNCVRKGDVHNVADYTLEPFSYLNGFLGEYATNYRAVADVSTYLEASVLKYAGKKNIEIALRQLTNNASKDVKGGVRLVQNWLTQAPAGVSRLEKLLTVLGMTNATITADNGNSEDSYQVIRKKQTGKVNYPHPIPAFGSLAETEGFRILCLYGRFNCDGLMDKFRQVNTVAKHTLVLLDFALNLEERRRLARKIKEEKSFAKSFIVVDRVMLFYLAKHYAANTISRMLMAVSMPFAYYQPFIEKSKDTMPPELFTGREAELVAIESAEGANLVYGGRQLGKSALLKMAQHNIDGNSEGDRAVLVELIGLDYQGAASAVSAKLINEGILEETCQTDDWDVLARHIETRLKDDKPETRIHYLLLMLDEADKFIESCKTVDYRPISVLKNLPSGRFKVVMAGLHNMSRFNRDTVLHRNSILVHLDSVVIRPFQRPEAIKLLTNTLAYLGFRFKPDVISLILAKTNYFPGLIQLYCQKLLEAMKNDDYAGYSEINTPSYEVTESHIKKVLSNPDFADMIRQKLEITLFVAEEGHSDYHIIALILSWLYETTPSETGHTIEDICRVAEEYQITRIIQLKKEQLEELLHEMWDLNIVSANGDHYFATDGFREMLGSRDMIEQKMNEYIEEGENA